MMAAPFALRGGFLDQLPLAFGGSSTVIFSSPDYEAILTPESIPRILLRSQGEVFFRLPIVSGLSSRSAEEKFSHVRILSLNVDSTRVKTMTAVANSSLWQMRRFVWKFFPDHIEFQQFAKGSRPVARCYFFSNGVSGYFDKGTSSGIQSNTIIDADRYFAPNPNFTNQLIHTIEQPQSLGVASSPYTEPVESVSRAARSHLFAPPPLALSFGHGNIWSNIGIGTPPGRYQFNSLEFSGEHYAGASFWVDYQERLNAFDFKSPVAALHFGNSALSAMKAYMQWMDARGFSTHRSIPNAKWHQLPIFCGWGEQIAIAGSSNASPSGHMSASELSTQENYTKWIAELDERGIPLSTIIVDDKWMKDYGTLEIDTHKWPDMGGFVEEQHAHNRHILLWIPMASSEGLPLSLTVTRYGSGKPISADVSNPAYEAFLRRQIHHLMADIGVDGFKEDWISPPENFSNIHQYAPLYGLEWVRRFQFIVFDEAHKCKKDAMVETQTPNPLYRDSSDVLRLNDIYSGTRDVPRVMRVRAEIAHIAGWNLVDTDNASTTTLTEWWNYMEAQPSIGIPSLYFVTETAVTHEKPSTSQWSSLASIWRRYITSLQ